MTGPLSGMRVLDLGRYVAGPWCAQLLQGYGAEVLRIERPGGGEDRPLFPIGPAETGAFFVHCNRGKRSMTLHVTRPEGREILGRLVDRADVVVANMPDESLAAMGLDWDGVHARNPRLVLATATTFGTSGPYAGKLGFDGIGQAMSGSAYLNGAPGAPVKSFVPWVDYVTATNLATGVLAALLERGTTGRGCRVESTLLGSALAVTGHILVEEAVVHPGREGLGNRHPAAGPSDLFPTSDGQVFVQVIGNPMFARVCRLLDRPDLAADPRFATDDERGRNSVELSAIVAAWTASRTTAEVLEAVSALGVPAGPLLRPAEALVDPHIASELLEQIPVRGLDQPVPVPVHPVRSAHLGDHAPGIGEHTDAVLAELGLDGAAVAELRAAGIV
jgi:crotonobetainyl-CoA:carnitine CoA-transferase CaiB-like acyl-CoA transferase